MCVGCFEEGCGKVSVVDAVDVVCVQTCHQDALSPLLRNRFCPIAPPWTVHEHIIRFAFVSIQELWFIFCGDRRLLLSSCSCSTSLWPSSYFSPFWLRLSPDENFALPGGVLCAFFLVVTTTIVIGPVVAFLSGLL
jgi:hypothetical protein